MGLKAYPVIDLAATGDNIRRLRMARGLTVRDLQSYFGCAEPRALFEVPLEQILIPVAENPDIVCEQQAETCCSHCFLTGCSGCGKRPMQLPPFAPGARPAA